MLWTQSEIKFLRENYGKVTKDVLEKELNRNNKAIHRKAKEIGLKGNKRIYRKYSINFDYFNKPNVENCYWAGFIAADGCLKQGRVHSDKGLVFHISKKDEDLLKCFVRNTNFSGKVTTILKNDIEYSSLEINGIMEWHQYLKEHWNITAKKTLTLIPPNLKQKSKLAWSYIRGYIDGDGSISYRKSGRHLGYPFFSVVGTYKVMEWIRNNLGIFNKISPCNKKGNIYQYGFSGTKVAQALHPMLCINTPFDMKRKWGNINVC